MNGWSATVGNRPVPVRTRDDLFQEVALPAGRSVVTFSFTPPHEEGGLAAVLVGLAAIVAGWVLVRRPLPRRRRRRDLPQDVATEAPASTPPSLAEPAPLSAR